MGPYTAQKGEHTEALTTFEGNHLRLKFQDGPIAEFGENGTTNEEIIALLVMRLRSLNEIMPCRQNSLAITKLEEALHWLWDRTNERQIRGVEGTHQP